MTHTDEAIGDRIPSTKEICRRVEDIHPAPLYGEDINSISGGFEAAMAAAGLKVPPAGLKADGKIRRCDVDDDKGEGTYQLDLGGIPAGWFQNNRDGASPRRWHVRTGQKRTAAEIAAYKQKARLQQAARKADIVQQQEETAKRAVVLIENSENAPASHPYLSRKNVQAHGLRYSAQPVAISPSRGSAPDVLIVPMRDIEDTLWNTQLIDATGTTAFLRPGRTSGCFFVIGKSGVVFTTSGLNPVGLNLICEEFATAATCFKAMDVPAVVAFDGGNLLPVAKALHAAYPMAKFIVCGDDDWKAQGNPGRTYAINAAGAIGAEVAFPEFSAHHCRSDKETDFNDLALIEGLGAVRDCIEAAEAVETIQARTEEPANAAIEAAIERLAALSDTDYELARKDEANKLGFRPTFLDKVVKKTKAANAAPPPGLN